MIGLATCIGIAASLAQIPIGVPQLRIQAECLMAVEGGPIVVKVTLDHSGSQELRVSRPFGWPWVTALIQKNWEHNWIAKAIISYGNGSMYNCLKPAGRWTSFLFVHQEYSVIPPGPVTLRLNCALWEHVDDERRNWRGRLLLGQTVFLKVMVAPATAEQLSVVERHIDRQLSHPGIDPAERATLAQWVLGTRHDQFAAMALRFLGDKSSASSLEFIDHVEEVSKTPDRARLLLLNHVLGGAPAAFPMVFEHWRQRRTVFPANELECLMSCDSPWIRALTFVTFSRQIPPTRREEVLNELSGRLAPRRSQQLGRLVADLDAESYAVRECASQKLERLAETADGSLRKALAGQPTPEVRRRAEALLVKLEQGHVSRESKLALTLLESWATPEARQVLRAMAAGTASLWRTKEAQAVLERLAKKE